MTPAPPAPAAAGYGMRDIEQMLGLSRRIVTRLVAAGFVTPARGPRNAWRFSFQDVVLLRTAHALHAADIAPRRMLQSLRRLQASLPAEMPLSGLRIRAVGNDIVVHTAGAAWQADSGQLLLDFEVAAGDAGAVRFLPVVAAAADADAVYARAEALDNAGDRAGAEAAYRQTLQIDPQKADAWVNLGVLLCDSGRCADAVALFADAAVHCPDAALVHYNRAIALEDAGRLRQALDSYERCLALEPSMADAHYNAARLHERLGGQQDALRHYSAYRRLSK